MPGQVHVAAVLDLFQGGRAARRVIAVAGEESDVRPAGFADAACELLTACWPHRDDLRRFIATGVSISGGTSPMAAVDWAGATSALDAGHLLCSAERRLLRLAASRAEGIPVYLQTAVPEPDKAIVSS